MDLPGPWPAKRNLESIIPLDDPLDVSKMTREERDDKRHRVAEYPDVARSLGLVREDVA